MQVGHVALFAEPIAEARNSEWFAKLRNEESQMAARSGVNDRAQYWMYWDTQLDSRGPLAIKPGVPFSRTRALYYQSRFCFDSTTMQRGGIAECIALFGR
jgi:hypothetical protein